MSIISQVLRLQQEEAQLQAHHRSQDTFENVNRPHVPWDDCDACVANAAYYDERRTSIQKEIDAVQSQIKALMSQKG